MAEDWSDEELESAVDAYQKMAQLELLKKPYNKRQLYRDLSSRHAGRTEKSFEYRMQNISAVLAGMGEKWVPGLKPAGHVGHVVTAKIAALLARPQKKTAVVPELAVYKAKLPAMRDWLIEVARAEGKKVRYGEVMQAFDIDRLSLRHAMDYLGHQADNLDEPIITALIVSKKTGRCSIGLAKEFNVQDDVAERVKLYEFWRVTENDPTPEISDSLEARAARFASVEVRPDQAAFRLRVFKAFDGRCAISGCDVPKALDAAHRIGRSWKLGHNKASDGILLRKDLHALYDARDLKIDQFNVVDCALGHYSCFHGATVKSSQ